MMVHDPPKFGEAKDGDGLTNAINKVCFVVDFDVAAKIQETPNDMTAFFWPFCLSPKRCGEQPSRYLMFRR